MTESKITKDKVSGLGNYVDLWDYIEPTRFIAPCDGYIVASSVPDPTGSRVTINLFGMTVCFARTTLYGYGDLRGCFVKKGTEISHAASGDTKGSFYFYPLI